MDADTPRRVLVLGARGFLGEHIVQELVARGCEVVAAVRPGSPPVQASARVRVIAGDLRDLAFVRGTLEGVEAAIFSAGRTWRPGLATAEYHRQNVGITRCFFEALGHRPQLRVVFTSSLAVVTGCRTPRPVGEDTDRRDVCESWLSPYARAKILCDQIALEAARQGNRIVILNPGQLVGPGARADSNLATAFILLWYCQGKAPFYIRGGMTVSDVRDVARAHVAALSRGQAGQRYLLGGHCLERGALYTEVARLTGLRPPRGLPARLVYLGMVFTDALALLSAGVLKSPIHRSFVRGEGLYFYGQSDAAIRELGYRIRPLEATLFDTLRHYHARGLLPRRLDFLGEVEVEDAPACALLAELARGHARARFLLPRIGQVYAACRSNRQLQAALARALEAGERPRLRSAERALLHDFFDYMYFTSNEFLRGVR